MAGLRYQDLNRGKIQQLVDRWNRSELCIDRVTHISIFITEITEILLFS
jgi:hypothetical protein